MMYEIRVSFYYQNELQRWLFVELTKQKKRHIITAFNMMAKIGVFKGLQYKIINLWED